MKKGSTVAAKQGRNFKHQKLTIGLDLGDRASWYCAQPDRTGDGDAFALGEPATGRVWTRGNRGACAQCAVDRGEPEER